MRLTNNQIGRVQLLVQAFSMAAGIAKHGKVPNPEAAAMRTLESMLYTACEWSDLGQMSSDLKDLYNSGHPIALTPERS